MKFFIVILLSLISIFTYSQQLNKIGKIEVNEIPQMPEYRIDKINGEYKIIKDSLSFDGNTFFELPNGFISSLEVFDDKKDYIKHYDANGKLRVTILTDRIINLKVSTDGNELAFFNTENILHINLNNYHIDTLSGSFTYAFIGQHDLIYYNSEQKNISYKGNLISIEQTPIQFFEFKQKVFVITKNTIFEIIGSTLNSRLEFEGEFFDSKIIGDNFYFVDKVEKRKDESFSLYKTTDFSRIMLMDRIDELNR